MHYEITIRKTEVETAPESQTFNKISDTGGEDGGIKYGYVSRLPCKKEVTNTIFSQVVKELNLLDIVKAINSIPLNG